jgi:hypothetical protein
VSSTKPDACGKKCTHFDYSDQNCGGCVPGEGKKCVRGVTTCVSGECIRGDGSTCAGECRSGEICCRGVCVTPQLDKRNCTGCGVECGPDEICCGSDGGCRNTNSDPRHCRRCDRICREEEPICYLGDCYKRCPNDLAECKSGRLRTCYEPERQLCCGGRVVSKDSLPEGAECCDDEIVVRPPGSFVCP